MSLSVLGRLDNGKQDIGSRLFGKTGFHSTNPLILALVSSQLLRACTRIPRVCAYSAGLQRNKKMLGGLRESRSVMLEANQSLVHLRPPSHNDYSPHSASAVFFAGCVSHGSYSIKMEINLRKSQRAQTLFIKGIRGTFLSGLSRRFAELFCCTPPLLIESIPASNSCFGTRRFLFPCAMLARTRLLRLFSG